MSRRWDGHTGARGLGGPRSPQASWAGRVQASWNRSRDSCSRQKGLTLFRLLSERVQLGGRTERPEGTAGPGRGLWPPLPPPPGAGLRPAFPGCPVPQGLTIPRMFNLCSKHFIVGLARKVHLGFSVASYGGIQTNVLVDPVDGPGMRGLCAGSRRETRGVRAEPGPPHCSVFRTGSRVGSASKEGP